MNNVNKVINERTRVPIMSDFIIFHNEPRVKNINPFGPQPAAATIGLEPSEKKHQVYDTLENSLYKQKYVDYKTTLVDPPKGFSHTGSGLGVNYKSPVVDPRYNLPKYGNTKPQMLNYLTSKSSLLFN